MADGILEYDKPVSKQGEGAGDPNDIYRRPGDPLRIEPTSDILSRLEVAGGFGTPKAEADKGNDGPLDWKEVPTEVTKSIDEIIARLTDEERAALNEEVLNRSSSEAIKRAVASTAFFVCSTVASISAFVNLTQGANLSDVNKQGAVIILCAIGQELIGAMARKNKNRTFKQVVAEKHAQNGTTTE